MLEDPPANPPSPVAGSQWGHWADWGDCATAPGVPLALPKDGGGGWGLSPGSDLGVTAEGTAAAGDVVAEGDSWGPGVVAPVGVPVPPLLSPVGGRDTTMYFWTLPVTVALGTVGAADTSFTTGWTLGTVVVTGEVAVGAGLVLKVITCGAGGQRGARGHGDSVGGMGTTGGMGTWGQCEDMGTAWGYMGTVGGTGTWGRCGDVGTTGGRGTVWGTRGHADSVGGRGDHGGPRGDTVTTDATTTGTIRDTRDDTATSQPQGHPRKRLQGRGCGGDTHDTYDTPQGQTDVPKMSCSPPPPNVPMGGTCCDALVPEADDMTMNLVGGGEGWVGVPGRPETRVCTGRVMALGTLMMLGGRGGPPWPWGACDKVKVGRGCGDNDWDCHIGRGGWRW